MENLEESKNKISKAKGLTKSSKKIAAFLSLALGSALAFSSATFAWFYLSTNLGASMSTFSGDLGVTIEKVSAYKYVYPYHNNSVEFIDYDAVGQVKSYVVEDANVETPNNLANKVTFTLGKKISFPYATSSSDENIGPAKIHYENSRNFKYYLIGNNTFSGVSTNPWSTFSATAFARKDPPAANEPVSIENIVVSKGAEFILFDANTINGNYCNYFTYNSPTTAPSGNSRFAVLDSNRIQCLASGIYKFDYRVEDETFYLDITLTSRSDNAVIGSNLIDPTKITIDYRGAAASTYASLNDYLPFAIHDQKTMVVLDVELSYQNKNPVVAGLQITRESIKSHSIYSFSGKYNTTNEYTFRGYVNNNNRNPLYASDFYAFSSLISKGENAFATPTDAWNAFHSTYQTDYEENNAGKQQIVPLANPYQKFQNDTSYDSTIECNLRPKTGNDSTFIPASSSNSIYHCYIAIDYDYERMQFFTNQDRVGKTFLLDRDFSFYFTAVEYLEQAQTSSSNQSSGGSVND